MLLRRYWTWNQRWSRLLIIIIHSWWIGEFSFVSKLRWIRECSSQMNSLCLSSMKSKQVLIYLFFDLKQNLWVFFFYRFIHFCMEKKTSLTITGKDCQQIFYLLDEMNRNGLVLMPFLNDKYFHWLTRIQSIRTR